MTDIKIKSKTALLSNVALFAQLMERLNSRTDKLPGIGVFYGFSGLGKTESAIYSANKFQAYYVQMGDSWTKKKFVEAILLQLGKVGRGSVADKVDEIVRLLSMDNKPLIIDEADYAFNKGFHEIIREIYDQTYTPIILLGEEILPQKISRHERFDNRVLEWVPAQPCNLEDVRKMADIYAPDVKVGEDLLDALMHEVKGIARRVAVNLSKIQELSYNEGVDGYSLKDWKVADHKFDTGQAPARRA